MKTLFKLFSVFLFFAVTVNAQYNQRVISTGKFSYASGEIIVKLKGAEDYSKTGISILDDQFAKKFSHLGIYSVERILNTEVLAKKSDLGQILSIKYLVEIDPETAAEKMKKYPDVLWAEPRYLYKTSYVPNDYDASMQWGLAKINATGGWDVTKGSSDVPIAIIDTGVDWDHPDLAANIWINSDETPGNGIDDDGNGYIDDYRGWDFGGDAGIPDADPMEDSPDHGTHVAGISGAVTDNNTGVSSIGFNCKIMAVKTSRGDFTDSYGNYYIAYGYEGIIYAAQNGAKVINCSWGGYGFSLLGQQAVDYAESLGALVVCAAGNDGISDYVYPASLVNALSVASTNDIDSKSSFSNYGMRIDVSAPGSSIYSTWQDDSYAHLSGTSMASPLVAGLAGLIFSQYPDYTPAQVRELIRVTCDNIDSQNPSYIDMLGAGRINAVNALTAVNPVSIRAYDIEYSDSEGGDGDGILESGETITINMKFMNYLSPVSNFTAQLSTSSLVATVNEGSYNHSYLGALDSANNSSKPFTFTISSDASQNAEINFKLTLASGGFSGFQWISLKVNPTYATFSINNLKLTVTSKGVLGYNDYPDNTEGIGFRYQNSETLLYEGAFMTGVSETKISDAARGSNPDNQNGDFAIQTPYVLQVPGTVADAEGSGQFSDYGAGSNKIGFETQLKTYAYADSPYDNFIILRYRIRNISGGRLSDFYAGLYFDWDGIDYTYDVVRFDSTAGVGYVYNMNDNPEAYIGMSLLADTGKVNFYAINNDGSDAGFSVYDGFTDAEKWTAMSGGTSKIYAGPGDISAVIAAGPFEFDNKEYADIAFIISAGTDLASLQNSTWLARSKADEIMDTSTTEPTPEFPEAYYVTQNYPNPFNPGTNIDLRLGEPGRVTIDVYDPLGKKVTGLLDRSMSPGNHTVSFTPIGLTSGIYFMKIRINGAGGNYNRVIKLVYVK